MLLIENNVVVAQVSRHDRAAALADIERHIAEIEAHPLRGRRSTLEHLKAQREQLRRPDDRVLVDAPGEIGEPLAAVLRRVINAEAERRILAAYPQHAQLNALASGDPAAVARMRDDIARHRAAATRLKQRAAGGEMIRDVAEAHDEELALLGPARRK